MNRSISLGKKTVREDVPTNNASSGQIAGIGVGPAGEPGGLSAVLRRMVKRKRTKNRTGRE